MLRYLSALTLVAACLAAPARKQLNGPPSEFASHAIPDATVGAVYRDAALLFFELDQTSETSWSTSMDLPVDSTEGFRLSVITPLNDHVTLQATAPDGSAFDLSKFEHNSFWPVGDGDQHINSTVYLVPNPTVGVYKLSIAVTGISKDTFTKLLSVRLRQNSQHGLVLLQNESPTKIFSHLSSYTASMRQNDDLGVNARMFDENANVKLSESPKGTVPKALRDTVTSAVMEIVYPDGSLHKIAMHDDGLHSDGEANDGEYGGDFHPADVGYYLVQSVFQGTDAAGNAFLRTSEHQVQIVPNDIELLDGVSADIDLGAKRLLLNLPVSEDKSNNFEGTYRAYAELWGTHFLTGKSIPVAWTSAIVNPSANTNGQDEIQLQVDLKWLLREGAVGPFTVKGAYLQEINTFVPVAEADGLSVKLNFDHALVNQTLHGLAATYRGEMTEEMRFGVKPQRNLTASTRRLIMLHGYCSDGNPWQKQPEDWPEDTLYFSDPQQTRSHDEFSNLVVEFAENNGASAYSLIGHSQGGIVTLHTLNYYFTGLDEGYTGGRKIQSLASPYQGNTGAGAWAEILGSLGGCGANQDLSRDGAQLWIVGLSAAAVEQQYYYTTQYDKGGLFDGGYCDMLTNAVLKSPNDGVTENEFANLDGATLVDHKLGQCHIDGMNWPASFWDKSRNAEMLAAAAL